jgi:hypothetical protein
MRIFSLALSAIEDLDVKLGSTIMVVEHQDPSQVQIMVFSKTRPTALEEYITLAIVIYFYLIRWSFARHFSWSFIELLAIHKIHELHRETLFLMALGTSKRKKENKLPTDDSDRGGCVKLRPDLRDACSYNIDLGFVLATQWTTAAVLGRS